MRSSWWSEESWPEVCAHDDGNFLCWIVRSACEAVSRRCALLKKKKFLTNNGRKKSAPSERDWPAKIVLAKCLRQNDSNRLYVVSVHCWRCPGFEMFSTLWWFHGALSLSSGSAADQALKQMITTPPTERLLWGWVACNQRTSTGIVNSAWIEDADQVNSASWRGRGGGGGLSCQDDASHQSGGNTSSTSSSQCLLRAAPHWL